MAFSSIKSEFDGKLQVLDDDDIATILQVLEQVFQEFHISPKRGSVLICGTKLYPKNEVCPYPFLSFDLAEGKYIGYGFKSIPGLSDSTKYVDQSVIEAFLLPAHSSKFYDRRDKDLIVNRIYSYEDGLYSAVLDTAMGRFFVSFSTLTRTKTKQQIRLVIAAITTILTMLRPNDRVAKESLKSIREHEQLDGFPLSARAIDFVVTQMQDVSADTADIAKKPFFT